MRDTKTFRTLNDLTMAEKDKFIDAASAVIIWRQLSNSKNPTIAVQRLKETLTRYKKLCDEYCIQFTEPKTK